MQRITLQAVKGGVQVVTGGQTSTTIVEGSFPGSTVSVFNTGSVVLATIFGDNLNPPTPKSNPFTAGSDGFAFFYAANGSRVDIQLSGTGITSPFTVAADVLLNDPSTFTVSAPSVVAFNANPTFNLSVASWFQMTLTGNVTGPVFSNAVAGDILLMTLVQDATGNRTFAWPAAFLRPPTIASAANAVTELSFKFDGTNWRSYGATGDNLQVPSNAVIAGTLAVGGGTALATTNQTGTGSLVLATSPTLTTPVLGAASATTINKLTLTQPATAATLTIANNKTLTVNSSTTLAGVDGKTLTLNNSITLVGTDGTTATFPNNSGTVAETNFAQTFTADQTIGTTTFNGTSGICTTYAGTTTVSNGLPSQVKTISLTGQNANIGATLLYAVPASKGGLYHIAFYIVITTAAGTSSTMPNGNIAWTDNDTNVGTAATVITASSSANVVGTNSVTAASAAGQFGVNHVVINAKAGTNINYSTTNYASNAAGAMQYTVNIRVVYWGS